MRPRKGKRVARDMFNTTFEGHESTSRTYRVWERVALLWEAGEYQRTTRERCGRRVSLSLVHTLWRVTDKERSDVCTIDQQRTFPMEKVGKIHGDVWSEVRNVHSRRVYQILTHPERGEEYWVTHIFLMVPKKALFGLLVTTVTDSNHPMVTFVRNNKEAAYALHTQIRLVVTQEKEEHWFAVLPSSRPPEGDTEAAQHRPSTHRGTDQLPSTESIRSWCAMGGAMRSWWRGRLC